MVIRTIQHLLLEREDPLLLLSMLISIEHRMVLQILINLLLLPI